jgi:hypothetical protein
MCDRLPHATPPHPPVSIRRWEAFRPIVRVCSAGRSPNEANATASPGRFRPVVGRSGLSVATLYGANRLDGALAETVLRDAATGSLSRRQLLGRMRALLVPLRPLELVDLTGWAHTRLRLPEGTLTGCGADYPATATWAQRFYDDSAAVDGLYWRSQRFDRAHALMLFGDRVRPRDLHVVLDETVPLWEGVGFEDMQGIAQAAGIAITAP